MSFTVSDLIHHAYGLESQRSLLEETTAAIYWSSSMDVRALIHKEEKGASEVSVIYADHEMIMIDPATLLHRIRRKHSNKGEESSTVHQTPSQDDGHQPQKATTSPRHSQKGPLSLHDASPMDSVTRNMQDLPYTTTAGEGTHKPRHPHGGSSSTGRIPSRHGQHPAKAATVLPSEETKHKRSFRDYRADLAHAEDYVAGAHPRGKDAASRGDNSSSLMSASERQYGHQTLIHEGALMSGINSTRHPLRAAATSGDWNQVSGFDAEYQQLALTTQQPSSVTTSVF